LLPAACGIVHDVLHLIIDYPSGPMPGHPSAIAPLAKPAVVGDELFDGFYAVVVAHGVFSFKWMTDRPKGMSTFSPGYFSSCAKAACSAARPFS